MIKLIHVICVILSFTGFFIRGIWMLKTSPLLQRRWVKTTPHIIDTLLLASAVILAVQMRLSPFEQPWLLAKIIALALYIWLGMVALRFGRSKRTRMLAWLSGLVTIAYIASVAVSKSVLGWFAFF